MTIEQCEKVSKKALLLLRQELNTASRQDVILVFGYLIKSAAAQLSVLMPETTAAWAQNLVGEVWDGVRSPDGYQKVIVEIDGSETRVP